MSTNQLTDAHAIRVFFRMFARVGLVALLLGKCLAADPVQFDFRLPASKANPFAREVWAEVIAPSGKNIKLPVYFAGDGRFAVRARAIEVGTYRLGRVTENLATGETVLKASKVSPSRVKVKTAGSLPQVGLNQVDHSRFVLGASDSPYTPIGANLAWATGEPVKFYEQALADFGAQHLNWIRIWMAHWGRLNLDWRSAEAGGSPVFGQLDLRVAADWDKIVSRAEHTGVYIQLVLQHHGQYSSQVNPNWPENPWNAANPGGFLKEPKDFFTSPTALEATRLKYRYIVARWGYSPAVLAWELFNEVHWVDPINREHNETDVARWHSEMADFLRSVDVYDHLVTTSTENLRSPIYERMDYFQPHLYAFDILAGTLTFNSANVKLTRPIFYGEAGDDHAPLNAEQKDSAIAIVPPVWASLFGLGRYPAQPWLGDKILQTNRLGELGAVARFLAATGLAARQDLQPFSSRVECAVRVPLVVSASQVWQRRAGPDFVLPLDGRVPIELADIPRTYVGPKAGTVAEYPASATYHVDFPRETTLRARVTGIGGKGTTLRISAGGKVVLEKTWVAGAADAPTGEHPAELSFQTSAGPQTLVVENPGAEDWFQLDAIETDIPVPVIAASGKRSDNFLALWLWHREGVFALQSPAPVGGTLLLDEVPAGKWTVTWWDTLKGIPAPAQEIEHPGGTLRLPVPAFNRHTAVVLTR